MKVSEADLLKSGFTDADLKKLKITLKAMAVLWGSRSGFKKQIQGAVMDYFWLHVSLYISSVFLTKTYILGGGLSLLIGVVIVTFIQPPMLAWKSWRYCRLNKELA